MTTCSSSTDTSLSHTERTQLMSTLPLLAISATLGASSSSSLAFQAPPICAEGKPTLLLSSPTDGIGSETKETLQVQQTELQKLCADLGIKTELVLGEDGDGIRGLYVGGTDDSEVDDQLLSVPLSSCLRDDEPPSWFQPDDEDDNPPNSYSGGSEWAIRLAASLIDLRLQQGSGEELNNRRKKLSTWISMLPDALDFRASLPIHWTSDVLKSAKCQALELAVDSAYFGRANAVMDLSEALKDVDQQSDDEILRKCHDALDVVQTRTCRVNLRDGDDSTPLRLLAPVFDLLNHDPSANAGFALERTNDDQEVLVVRATRPIARGEEVFISYGDSSTAPAWKCLLSYGFVPQFDISDFRNAVELECDGVTASVAADNVPFELAEAAAGFLAAAEDRVLTECDDIFTPEVARRIAKRAAEEAGILLEGDGEILVHEETALSMSLAKALRLSHHRVLESWSNSLMEFADAND